jgi:WD40 repeat protein
VALEIVKVWDLRARKCVFSCKHHTDYIAAISNFSDSELVVVSGDGTLSVVDLRKRRATAQSDSRQARAGICWP